MFYIIAYDIAEDRVRTKAAKVLDGYGRRVQKSVYECSNLTEAKLLHLLAKLEKIIDHTTDSVRCYHLCRGCLARFEGRGMGDPPQIRTSGYF